MTDFVSIATAVGGLGAASIALATGSAWVVRRVRTVNARLEEFLEDWNGVDARPGVPHKPGVMERLSQQDDALAKIDGRLVAVEAEVNYNGGKSMKDIVHRVDGNLKHIRTTVEDLSTRVTNLEGRP
jgi:hypothetical protein